MHLTYIFSPKHVQDNNWEQWLCGFSLFRPYAAVGGIVLVTRSKINSHWEWAYTRWLRNKPSTGHFIEENVVSAFSIISSIYCKKVFGVEPFGEFLNFPRKTPILSKFLIFGTGMFLGVKRGSWSKCFTPHNDACCQHIQLTNLIYFRTLLSSTLVTFCYSPTIVSQGVFERTKINSYQEGYKVKLREHFLSCDLQCSWWESFRDIFPLLDLSFW